MNEGKIIARSAATELGKTLRENGKKIVCVSGSFDVMHAGHVDQLTQARSHGDVLVVLLNSDKSVRTYKGSHRPVIPEQYRAAMLVALRPVDFVIIFDDVVPNAVLADLQPDILVNGAEYGKDSVEAGVVASYGGEVVLVRHKYPLSTSDILKRINAAEKIPSKKAVFLDRDGTIIDDVGYLHLPEEVRFKEGVFDALRSLQEAGYLLFIVTNQSGVGRGMFEEEDVKKTHDYIHDALEKEGISITGTYYCPHHPDDGCECRKPNTGMLLQAAREHDIALSSSWMIGDKCSDIAAGRFANTRTVLLGDTNQECSPGPQIRAETFAEGVSALLDWSPEKQ